MIFARILALVLVIANVQPANGRFLTIASLNGRPVDSSSSGDGGGDGSPNQLEADDSNAEDSNSLVDPPDHYERPKHLAVVRVNASSVVLVWSLAEEASYAERYVAVIKVQYGRSPYLGPALWQIDPADYGPSTRACFIDNLSLSHYRFEVTAVYRDQNNTNVSAFLNYKLDAIGSFDDKMPAPEAPRLRARGELSWSWIELRWDYQLEPAWRNQTGFLLHYNRAAPEYDGRSLLLPQLASEHFYMRVADLRPNTTYWFRLVAFNGFGQTRPSEAAFARTLQSPYANFQVPSSDSEEEEEADDELVAPEGERPAALLVKGDQEVSYADAALWTAGGAHEAGAGVYLGAPAALVLALALSLLLLWLLRRQLLALEAGKPLDPEAWLDSYGRDGRLINERGSRV